MKSLKNLVIVLFVVVFSVGGNAQRCTPGTVPNISLSATYTLTWAKAANLNNCTITSYVVYIFDPEDGTQLQFQTNGTLSYNVAFLDMCKTYDFEVHALTSEYVLGPSERIDATTAPGANMNLSLALKNSSHVGNQFNFSWDVITTSVAKCVSYYRVVYWDENNNAIDVYVTNTNFSLAEGLVPCMEYTFQVNAIISNPDIEGPLTELTYSGYAAVAEPPKLQSIITSSTSVNMTWQLPTYSENRCKLTALLVNTLGAPANVSAITVSIQDSPLRPNLQVLVSGLSPDHVYTSYVSLVNSAGPSKNVTVSYQTSSSLKFEQGVHKYFWAKLFKS